jgi:hypothetical protein
MSEPTEETVALSAEEVAEITGEAEEQDETGAPEKVAETEDEHPLESPDAIRRPRDQSGADESATRVTALPPRDDG